MVYPTTGEGSASPSGAGLGTRVCSAGADAGRQASAMVGARDLWGHDTVDVFRALGHSDLHKAVMCAVHGAEAFSQFPTLGNYERVSPRALVPGTDVCRGVRLTVVDYQHHCGLMTYMLVSAPWYGSTLAWTAAGPIVAAIVGVPLFLATYFPPKGRLLHSISMTERLFNPVSAIPRLKMMYDSREVGDLHRITIRLASRGRKDIEFHKDQPMVFDVGVRIVDILDRWFSDGSPVLDTVTDDTKLMVGPGPGQIIRKGGTIEFTALVDGAPKYLRCQLPFKDTVDREPGGSEPLWFRNLTWTLFGNYILVLILYGFQWRPIEIIRPLFLYLFLMELIVWLAAIIAIRTRRWFDR